MEWRWSSPSYSSYLEQPEPDPSPPPSNNIIIEEKKDEKKVAPSSGGGGGGLFGRKPAAKPPPGKNAPAPPSRGSVKPEAAKPGEVHLK